MGDAYKKHAPVLAPVSLPKPSLSINYRQDEMQLSVWQPLISPSQRDPAQRHICCFSVLSLSERDQKDEKNYTKMNSPRRHKKIYQWIIKKCSRRKSAKSQRERDKKTKSLFIFPSPPVASWLSWQHLIPGLVHSLWGQLGNQVREGHMRPRLFYS